MVQHSHTVQLALIHGYATSWQQIARILPGTMELERVTRWCDGQNLQRKPEKKKNEKKKKIKIITHRKIPKISPSVYKPLQI